MKPSKVAAKPPTENQIIHLLAGDANDTRELAAKVFEMYGKGCELGLVFKSAEPATANGKILARIRIDLAYIGCYLQALKYKDL